MVSGEEERAAAQESCPQPSLGAPVVALAVEVPDHPKDWVIAKLFQVGVHIEGASDLMRTPGIHYFNKPGEAAHGIQEFATRDGVVRFRGRHIVDLFRHFDLDVPNS